MKNNSESAFIMSLLLMVLAQNTENIIGVIVNLICAIIWLCLGICREIK